jgi:toxoflavin synthase
VKQFDPIAAAYQRSNYDRPLMKDAAYPSIMTAVGDVRDLDALDAGCGDGIVARALKKNGARRVVAIDESEGMIQLAAQQSGDIEYAVGSIGYLGMIDEFDVITGAFLLHYAKSREELYAMCADIYINLKPGGKFVAINNNPLHPLSNNPAYRNIIRCKRVPREGDALLVEHPGTPVRFTNYYWSRNTYEEALKQFRNVQWTSVLPTEEAVRAHGGAFWKNFLEHPFFTIIRAEK